MQDVAQLLNFKSEKAQFAAKKVTDFHKGWTMLKVSREALLDELITEYVRSELSQSSDEVELNPRNLVEFVRKSPNPNVRFMAYLVFPLLSD